MKSSIKIIKRKRDAEETKAKTSESDDKVAEPSAREITRTVKNWITEFKERKSNQSRSLPVLAALRQEPASPEL